MSSKANLLSMPEEVLCHLGSFLKPQDLLALSATCTYLRSALNDNCLWRKYSLGGLVSQSMEETRSEVFPLVFEHRMFPTTNLVPLCEQRLHFLRQSRLVSNFKEGKFVQHSVPFEGYFSSTIFESTLIFTNRQITYKDSYLFALQSYSFSCSRPKKVFVFNIKSNPFVLSLFELVKHTLPLHYDVIVRLQVVEDLLVIQQDNWFDIYDITLPVFDIPLRYSININSTSCATVSSAVIIQNFLFVENRSATDTHFISVWDVKSGVRLDISPKFVGSSFRIQGFKICNYSQDKKYVFFYLEEAHIQGSPNLTLHLFVYSLNSFQYTDFYVNLSSTFDPHDPLQYFGEIESSYVIFIDSNCDELTHVLVYDFKNSSLIVEKFMGPLNWKESCIIKDHLVLCSILHGVEILNLTNLETVWNLTFTEDYNSCSIKIIFHHFIAVTSGSKTEVWDFESRRKCFNLHSIRFIAVSDFNSKLILQSNKILDILSFW